MASCSARRLRLLCDHLSDGSSGAELAPLAAAADWRRPPPVDLEQWRRDGVLVFPNFFSAEEMAPLVDGVDALLEDVQAPSAADDAGLAPALVDPHGRGRSGGVAGLYTQKFDTEMLRLDGQITRHFPEAIAALEFHPRLHAATEAILGSGYTNVENMCSASVPGPCPPLPPPPPRPPRLAPAWPHPLTIHGRRYFRGMGHGWHQVRSNAPQLCHSSI